METDQAINLLKNEEYEMFDTNASEVDENDIEAKLQVEEENLIADILLVELDNADNIDMDSNSEKVRKEIQGISHDIVDITNIW